MKVAIDADRSDRYIQQQAQENERRRAIAEATARRINVPHRQPGESFTEFEARINAAAFKFDIEKLRGSQL